MADSVDRHFSEQSIRASHSISPLAPRSIVGSRQLVMDESLVHDTWNCTRVVHQPTKHARNPVIPPGGVLGRGMPWSSVLYDEELARFRLWGSAHSLEEGTGRIAYFESEDGLEWTAPSLNQVEYQGSRANNIVRTLSPDRLLDGAAITRMPPAWEHVGQFAMVRGSIGQDLKLAGGAIDLAFSDDGIHWTDHAANPAIAGIPDTHNNLVYVPERQAFVLYHRPTVNAFHVRRIAATESTDLETWSQPRTVLVPDELDPPMFYGMTVDRYEGLFLGFLMVYYRTDIEFSGLIQDRHRATLELPKELQMENQLAWSRDGLTWSRHPARPTVLPTGRRYQDHDWGLVRKGTGIVERGDELYLYYQGADRIKKTPRTDRFGEWSINLATIRRDGFLSMEANGDGFLVTVPIAHPGGRLHINASTDSGGSIWVGVRRGDGDRDGEWCPGFRFEDSVAFTGDSTDHIVRWVGDPSQDAMKGTTVRLHFWLMDASLFSFWVESTHD